MNYQKVYNQIIDKAKSQDRRKGEGVYYESHHILSVCMGGEGKLTQWKTHPNIVLLTGREHFICHWLLIRLYPKNEKLWYAFWGMCNQKSKNQERYVPSSRAYNEAREVYSKMVSERPGYLTGVTGSDHPMYNRTGSLASQFGKTGSLSHLYGKPKPEFSEYLSSRTGSAHPFYGVTGSSHFSSKPIVHLESGLEFASHKEAAGYFSKSPETIRYQIKKGIFKEIKK